MKDINFLVNEPEATARMDAGEQKKSIPAAQIVVFVIGFTVAILLLFIPGIIIAGLEKQTSEVEKSMQDPKYAELRNVKADLANITQRVEGKKSVIRDIDQKNTSASQILVLVEQAIPADCFIKTIGFNGSSISLSGTASNSIVYTELVGNLNRLQQLQGKGGALSMAQSFVPVDFTLSYTLLK
ncbi:MAG: pilus assembly protein PilN [Thermoclostridium sp.]|nr:pilus assembly protein PilN [Thermoclostridium sp.]